MEKVKGDLKGLNYPVKVLLAWGESISGNEKITEWLLKNGYTELGLCYYAVRNEDRSREWLMKNGFPHIMAMIHGAEGSEKALEWLEKNGYETLRDMALIGDGDTDAFEKLLKKDYKVFAMVAKKIESIKDEIEVNKSDFHRYYSS